MIHTAKNCRFFTLLLLITAGLLFSLAAEYILPFDAYSQNLLQALQPPSAAHLLGTDRFGRDMLARTIAGAKITVFTALIITFLASSLGSLIGLFCGYHRNRLVTILLRLTDVFLAFPSMVFAIAAAGLLGGGTFNAAAAIMLVSWPKYTRLVRTQTLPLRQTEYIEAARMSGSSSWQIMFFHILPVIVGPICITAALDIGTIITEIAGLSFLGLGTAPPAAEWGSMMSGARNLLQTAPWTIFAPGIAIFITVSLFQLFADSLRDFFDIH
ncbi:ABC transporter permease [Megasphaera paucivorans]|uniref:Peptide/nickel transport system permease protein n=1 Tax=Megasphaera paucivorans TaxID=349095 RepID=A0A1G9V5J0_9FIRM|nr:ABC transporter permease [Megasphaera paucivorans]SDM67350.1 peptide/nickel transport system permease protein [Megasphaera paucivorans]